MSNVRFETRPERLAAAHAWARILHRQQADLARVRALLAEFYEPEEADLFLDGRNELLDGRTPRDLIMAGETEDVVRLLRRLGDEV